MIRGVALAFLSCACLLPGARAGEAPPAKFIISTAQHFVKENFDRPIEYHFRIGFDIAEIHPQPGGDFWAVIGGFTAKTSAAGYERHIFVAGIRLICAEFEKLECWKLEKLGIDKTILVDTDTKF